MIRPDQVPNVWHLRVQHTFSSMTSSPSRSSKRREVVDEFRQHDGVVTVLVKNNLRRASPSTTETMTKDKLEGTGLPAHGLVFLDVSWVLPLPLYLYVEPWGRNLEQKPPQSRFCPKGKSPTRTPGPNATILGIWPRHHGPRRLAQGQTPRSPAFGPLASA